MTTRFSQSVLGTLDTAIAGASLNGLASGAYALGAAINNTPTAGSVVSYDMADLTITLSGAVTTGASSVYLTVWILPAVDGTNYPNPPGASAGAAPLSLVAGTYQGVAGVSTLSMQVMNLPIPPCSFMVMIQNNLGVALPATTTSTCQLSRKTVANW
jgi:hypothetical protein